MKEVLTGVLTSVRRFVSFPPRSSWMIKRRERLVCRAGKLCNPCFMPKTCLIKKLQECYSCRSSIPLCLVLFQESDRQKCQGGRTTPIDPSYRYGLFPNTLKACRAGVIWLHQSELLRPPNSPVSACGIVEEFPGSLRVLPKTRVGIPRQLYLCRTFRLRRQSY